MAGKGDLLGVGQFLLRKDENRVFVHRPLDHHHRFRIERAAAVDPDDFCGKDPVQRADR